MTKNRFDDQNRGKERGVLKSGLNWPIEIWHRAEWSLVADLPRSLYLVESAFNNSHKIDLFVGEILVGKKTWGEGRDLLPAKVQRRLGLDKGSVF